MSTTNLHNSVIKKSWANFPFNALTRQAGWLESASKGIIRRKRLDCTKLVNIVRSLTAIIYKLQRTYQNYQVGPRLVPAGLLNTKKNSKQAGTNILKYFSGCFPPRDDQQRGCLGNWMCNLSLKCVMFLLLHANKTIFLLKRI